ncbi:MAG: hypothetical protein OHK0017_02060 [Patescibacteria group bacterium]
MRLSLQYSWIKVILAGVMITFIVALWAYVQTEVLTSTVEFDPIPFCGEDLKYYKLLNYDERAGRAEILCIKNQPSDSKIHQLSLSKIGTGFRTQWTIVYSRPAYPEKSFTWPIYL